MRYRAAVKTTLLAIAVSVSMACGGGNKVVHTTSPGGEGDDPATPFGDGAVKAKLRAMPGSAECGLSPSTTLGDAFQTQKNQLKSAGMVTEEHFGCTARPDNRWDCTWSVAGKLTEEPDLDEPIEPTEPTEPTETVECEAPSPAPTPFTVTATVGSDGSVNAKDVHCAAAS
jgi:hypothetical protein